MKLVKSILTSLSLLATSSAVTIRVEGFLEGDVMLGPERGETMDYYKFSVTNPGTVRIDVPRFYAGPQFYIARFIGREDEFAFLGFRIDPPGPCIEPNCPDLFFERSFEAGEYVVVLSASSLGPNSSYDVFDGYVPVNREGGGFSQFPYQYDITGPVTGLEYWDGHLDGTFTVTSIPEPSSILLTCLGLTALIRKRR
jgi:hypothetical protein